MSYIIESREHLNNPFQKPKTAVEKELYDFFQKESYNYNFSKEKNDLSCFSLSKNEDEWYLYTNYYIGVDWIEKEKCALYVAPKVDNSEIQVDYVKMLFEAMRHSEVGKHLDNLYEIKWDEKPIEITQNQDLLTPLLITEFLSILKKIVRKGLKKSYYKVERKLNSKVKGKINIGKTVKHHLSKQKKLETICTFEEFGVDNKENRILKKALQFIKRYLPQYHNIGKSEFLQNTLNFITPAFHQVSTKVSTRDIQTFKSNAFFKEYDRGLQLARMILERFGYNISKTETSKIQTPPFWIDMSNLFELYVLGLLKDKFGKSVTYHFKTYGNELDYLLNSPNHKMVIDAKYKPQYEDKLYHQDMRQLSGYARLKKVHNELGLNPDDKVLIDCLVIYPKQSEKVLENSEKLDLQTEMNKKCNQIEEYIGFYKIPVQLPTIS